MNRGGRHIGGSPRFGGADRLKPTYTIPTSKPGISLDPYSDLQIVPSDISWSNHFDFFPERNGESANKQCNDANLLRVSSS